MIRRATCFCLAIVAMAGWTHGSEKDLAVQRLIKQFRDEPKSRISTIEKLGDLELHAWRAEPILLACSFSRDERMRAAAQSAYIRLGCPKSILKLFQFDFNESVRESTAWTLLDVTGDIEPMLETIFQFETSSGGPMRINFSCLSQTLSRRFQLALIDRCIAEQELLTFSKASWEIEVMGDGLASRLERLLAVGGRQQIEVLEYLIVLGWRGRPLCSQVEKLVESEDWNVALTAAAAMVAIHPRPGPYLERLLSPLRCSAYLPEETPGQLDEVDNILGGDDLWLMVSDNSPAIAKRARHLISVLGPRARGAISELTRMLRAGDSTISPRLLVRLLAEFGQPAVTELANALESCENVATEIAILDALQEFETKAAATVPALVRRLKSRQLDTRVRVALVTTLGLIGPAASVAEEQLCATLGSPIDDERIEAAKSLFRIGVTNPKTVAALAKRLSDSDEKVRLYSGLSLLQQGVDPDLVCPVLLDLLDSPDEDVPTLFFLGLAQVGSAGKPVIPYLQAYLERQAPNGELEGSCYDIVACLISLGATDVDATLSHATIFGKYQIARRIIWLKFLEPDLTQYTCFLRSLLKRRVITTGHEIEAKWEEYYSNICTEIAARNIGQIGPAAYAAAADLADILKVEFDDPPDLQDLDRIEVLVWALGQIGERAADAAPILERWLSRRDLGEDLTSQILLTLLQIEPNSVESIGRGRELLSQLDIFFSRNKSAGCLAEAMKHFESRPELCRALLPELKMICHERNVVAPALRQAAARIIVQISSEDNRARTYLRRGEF